VPTFVEPIVCVEPESDNQLTTKKSGKKEDGHGHDLLEICCSSSWNSQINMKYYSLLEIFDHFIDFIKYLH